MVYAVTMKYIDTLAKFREYLAAGYTEPQAEVAVKSWAEAYDMAREDLATKADLRILETEINSKIDKMETEINFKIDKMETEINSKIDKLDNKMNYMYIIGGGIFTVCCIPVLQKLF